MQISAIWITRQNRVSSGCAFEIDLKCLNWYFRWRSRPPFGLTDVALFAGLEGKEVVYKSKKNMRSFQKALFFSGYQTSMPICRHCSEKKVWRLICDALCQLWLEEHSVLVANVEFDKVMRLQIGWWSFILVLSVKGINPTFLFYANAEQIERMNENLPQLTLQNQFHVVE